MAIAFDASSIDTYHTNTVEIVFSHTCSGNNRILFVYAGIYSGSYDITGVTYNGVSLTKIDGQAQDGNNKISLWYLINPDSGTHDVSITTNDTVDLWGGAVSYTGVSQTDPINASSKGATGAATSFALSVTTDLDKCWSIMGVLNTGGAITAGAGTTLRENDTASHLGILDSNSAISPAGSNTLTAEDSNQIWGGVMAAFEPAATFIPQIIIM